MHNDLSISIDSGDDVTGFGGKAGGVVQRQQVGAVPALGLPNTFPIGEGMLSHQPRPAGSKLGGSCEG